MDSAERELQQYLFDLHGYLVIHDVLGAAELAELNRLIDAQRLPGPRESIRFGSAAGKHGPDHGFLSWGEPFCRLLDHEAIMPILRFRLGDCFRLDRLYGIRMQKGQTMGSMHADYGASAPNSFTRPGERFHFAANGIYEGFTVVAWSLADAGPAHGGFWCIPGSHKSHFKLPRQIHDAPERASCVVTPEVPAGSVVLFSEAGRSPHVRPLTLQRRTRRGAVRRRANRVGLEPERFRDRRKIHVRKNRQPVESLDTPVVRAVSGGRNARSDIKGE